MNAGDYWANYDGTYWNLTRIYLTDNNTTYSSKTAASGGTDVSLVTTGEKYTWNNKQNAINSSNKLAASNVSGLATVATSGSYNDLSNKPTIPTVNNATLTIQKNGTNVATFTANSSTNQTANITVPTKVSELTNDAGYKTTDNNTTYTITTGDSNGQIKVTPSSGTAYNVSVKGLGSSAYTTTYTATECTTFTSDSGNCTPAAVQKAAKQFAYAGALTGYSKASSVSAIAATDTIVAAIGKLEKALDSKGTSSFSGSYNDLTNKPTIPSAVTESTVSGWGFTKNAGTVTGSSLTANYFVVGNGNSAIKASSMQPSTSSTT